MKGSRVANRYAKALFELAIEKKLLSAVKADLTMLGKEYQRVPEFRQLMESPVIPQSVKRQTFAKLFKNQLQSLTYHFIQLLFEKKRESKISEVIASFDNMMDAHRGIIRGSIHSVEPLSSAQLNALKARLDKVFDGDVQLEQLVDKQLLGGFVVKIADQVFDSSLRNQLESLRKSLVYS